MNLPRNIILAGFMGTGKTTVGRALAARLGWKFVDTDHLIEQRTGRTIPEIFEQQGEPAFRQLETETASEIKDLRRHVVAAGGGMVVNPVNRDLLAEAGQLVLLEANASTIYERVRRTSHRPLLKKEDPKAEIEKLLSQRAEAYTMIDLKVDTDEKNANEIVDEILKLIKAC